MVYRRFGSVYARLLLSKQDEMGKLEARLLALDRTDEADGNGHFLMSRGFDVEREEIPEAWEGESRVRLLERAERVAGEYGMCFCFFLFCFGGGFARAGGVSGVRLLDGL